MGKARVEKKQWTQNLTHEDKLDVTLVLTREHGKKQIKEFAVSYRAKVKGRWREVIRYDTAHGYLHVQKFWRTDKPIPLPELEILPYDKLIRQFVDEITDNMYRYRSYIESKLRGEFREKNQGRRT